MIVSAIVCFLLFHLFLVRLPIFFSFSTNGFDSVFEVCVLISVLVNLFFLDSFYQKSYIFSEAVTRGVL